MTFSNMTKAILLLSAGTASSFTVDDSIPKNVARQTIQTIQTEHEEPQERQSQKANKINININSSVLTFPEEFNQKTYDTWSKLSPFVWSKRQQGLECELTWKKSAPTWIVVDNLLHKISPWFVNELANEEDKISLQEDIHHSIKKFQEVCGQSLSDIDSYKIKVSAKYGPTATQCPAWHADTVPMRWIQAMFGPGCYYIHSDDTSNEYIDKIFKGVAGAGVPYGRPGKWKEEMVKRSGVKLHQTVAGDPVILIGRLWSNSKVAGLPELSPVLHRSPLNVPSKQGRVLLTLDVITTAMKEEDDECNERCCQK